MAKGKMLFAAMIVVAWMGAVRLQAEDSQVLKVSFADLKTAAKAVAGKIEVRGAASASIARRHPRHHSDAWSCPAGTLPYYEGSCIPADRCTRVGAGWICN